MSRITADLRAFGLQYLRSPVGAFFSLAFPIILILIFGSVFSEAGSTQVPLSVQDKDGSFLSSAFLQTLNETGSVKISMVPASLDIEEYIKQKSLSVALLIPEGFEESVMGGNSTLPVNVTLYGDQSQSTYGIVAGAVSAAATAINFQISNATPVVGLETRSIVAQNFKYIDFFLPGMIAFTVMTNSLMAQSSLTAEYKTRGFFKLLAITPLRKGEWVIAKYGWYLMLMSVSIGLMYAVSIPLFGVQLTITAPAVAIILTGILLFMSMGMLIGVATKDPESASAVANAIGFPMMFLSGTFFPIEMMPKFLQAIATVLPLTYMSEGLRATMIYGNESSALIDLVILVVLGVAFFVAASKLMSWKER